MKYVLKEMSKEELPREKLKKYGPSSLSDYELLAIILKTGTNGKSVIDLSIEVMSYFYSIDKLEEATINELMSIRGIGEAKALVEGAPATVKENAPKADAEALKKSLEDAGATVELK